MPLVVCLAPGCGQLVDKDTRGRRCKVHRRQLEHERGSRQARGYDAMHEQLRASYQRRMDAGQGFYCWRCGRPIDPASWHLGHDDYDRTRYQGPECVPCSTATVGRQGVPPPPPPRRHAGKGKGRGETPKKQK